MINSLQLHRVKCPSCNHSGDMSRHAFYTRHCQTEDGIIPLKILRLICSCGHTHALLLSVFVPYSRHPLFLQAEIALKGCSDQVICSLQLRFPDLNECSVRSIYRVYRRKWREPLISEGIIPYLSDTTLLVTACFDRFFRQFMQIKCTPNKLFHLTT